MCCCLCCQPEGCGGCTGRCELCHSLSRAGVAEHVLVRYVMGIWVCLERVAAWNLSSRSRSLRRAPCVARDNSCILLPNSGGACPVVAAPGWTHAHCAGTRRTLRNVTVECKYWHMALFNFGGVHHLLGRDRLVLYCLHLLIICLSC